MRLTGKEREARDTLVLRMFLAGVTYRDIGRKVDFSLAGVHKVIKRELRTSADRRDDIDEAVEAYLARMETLLAASWPKALSGEARSAEQCRRLLDAMGRVQGVFPGAVIEHSGERPPPTDDDDDDQPDELDQYRQRRAAKYE